MKHTKISFENFWNALYILNLWNTLYKVSNLSNPLFNFLNIWNPEITIYNDKFISKRFLLVETLEFYIKGIFKTQDKVFKAPRDERDED